MFGTFVPLALEFYDFWDGVFQVHDLTGFGFLGGALAIWGIVGLWG